MSDHTTSFSSRPARAGRELALTIGALAGLVCVLAAAASMLFGIKPLVFRSGSMSPEITTGSMALARSVPATDLVVGDIVSVVNGQGTRITHRVYDMESQTGNSVDVWLKGDANAIPDTETYSVTEADRIFFSVGGLGYAVAWLSSPIAVFLGGAFVAGLLMVAFRPSSRKDDSEDGPSGGVANSGTESVEPKEFSLVSAGSGTAGFQSSLSFHKLAILGATALVVLGATQISATSAAFTTNLAAKSGALSTSSNIVPAIGSIACQTKGAAGFESTTVTWPHIGDSYRYITRYYNGNTSLNKSWERDPGATASPGTISSINMYYNDASGSNYTYTLRVYTIDRATGQESTAWRGMKLKRAGALTSLVCAGEDSNVTASSFAGDAPSAEDAPLARGVAPSTTAGAVATTTAPTTTDVTTTTDAMTTTETSTSTTTESATPTTTTSATTTTATPSKEVPIAVGEPETSSIGDTATLMQSSTGVAVVVTNSAGKEISSTPVSGTAEVKWQSDAESLWIVDGTDIYQVFSSGKSTKATAADAPVDIAAWIDGLK